MGSPEILQSYRNKDIASKMQIFGWPKSIGLKHTWYSNNGFQLSAKPETPIVSKRKATPGDTEIHEATHAVVAEVTDGENGDAVDMVTTVPGSEYNGLTKLKEKNPIAAIAPHSVGHKGTGYDVLITSLMTDNVGSAVSVAKSIVITTG